MTPKAAIYVLFQLQQTFGSPSVRDIESWACLGSKLDPEEQAGKHSWHQPSIPYQRLRQRARQGRKKR